MTDNFSVTHNENADLRLLLSSGFFNREWYLSVNPDVAEAKIDPAMHFLQFGGVEGRSPGPRFSSRWYLDTYEDVRLMGENPLIHYLKHGKSEGRTALSMQDVEDIKLIESSDLFNRDWYLMNNPDVAELRINPALHYIRSGGFEGRDPGEEFSSSLYLDIYEDVKQAGMNPLVHYLRYGHKEGRYIQSRQRIFQELASEDVILRPADGETLHQPENYPEIQPAIPVSIYDVIYNRFAASATLKSIWRSVYEDFPDEAITHFSFVTFNELTQIADYLSIGRGDCFIDVACGQGNISLWIAQKIKAFVIGIDYSMVAIQFAQSNSISKRRQNSSLFIQCDGSNIALNDNSLDGATCIDSLHAMPNPKAVIIEVARILKPGAVFAFTGWAIYKPPLPGRMTIPDYRPLLEGAGFVTEKYYEPKGWQEKELSIYRKILENRHTLKEELGQEAIGILLDDAVRKPSQLVNQSRVLVVARKQ